MRHLSVFFVLGVLLEIMILDDHKKWSLTIRNLQDWAKTVQWRTSRFGTINFYEWSPNTVRVCRSSGVEIFCFSLVETIVVWLSREAKMSITAPHDTEICLGNVIRHVLHPNPMPYLAKSVYKKVRLMLLVLGRTRFEPNNELAFCQILFRWTTKPSCVRACPHGSNLVVSKVTF